MDNQEAIKHLEQENKFDSLKHGEAEIWLTNRREMRLLAISALEKQIPKKPKLWSDEGHMFYICPVCGNYVSRNFYFCSGNKMITEKGCGQKLDWSE